VSWETLRQITGHSLKTVHRILERYLARTSGLAEQSDHQLGELRANKVCKPTANRQRHVERLERES